MGVQEARADDFPHVKSMKCTLSKMKKYMKAVLRAANKVGIEVGVDGKLIKSVAKANLVYEKVHKLFEYNHPWFKRRNVQLVWRTMFDIFAAHECKYLGEE